MVAHAYDFRKDPKSPKMQSKESPAKSSSSSERTGPLRSIRIECAENGYTVICDHAPPKSSKNSPMEYTPPKEYVFKTAKETLAYIAKKLED